MAGERDVLALAALIRKVDGNHDLGASALAEALIDAGWPPPEPLPLDVERLARAPHRHPTLAGFCLPDEHAANGLYGESLFAVSDIVAALREPDRPT